LSGGENRSRRIAPAWSEGAALRWSLVTLYGALAVMPVVLVVLFGGVGQRSAARLAGQWSGLVGLALLALQVIGAVRLRLFDRPLGLDAVMRAHRAMGLPTLLLLIAHPVMLAVDMGNAYLFSLKTGAGIGLGKAALGLLVAAVLISVVFAKLRIDYLWMRLIHSWAAPAVLLLGAWHAFAVGSDMDLAALKAYWYAVLLGAMLLFLVQEFWIRRWGRRRFRVSDVKPETHNVWTLALEPERGDVFPYRPGQFAFLTLRREGARGEEHPFTISSSPTQEGSISFTIKESGDFTRTIAETKPGDGALLQAPYGRFSLTLRPDAGSFLFVAGGVGITPIMSMLRWLRDTGDARPAVLFYGSRTEGDIVFREEITSLPGNVKTVHVLSEPGAEWAGPAGRVTAEMIREHAGDLLGEAEIYLCGPPPMMSAILADLKSLGVPRRRVHCERFAL
jgi:predicted ferric reductase